MIYDGGRRHDVRECRDYFVSLLAAALGLPRTSGKVRRILNDKRMSVFIVLVAGETSVDRLDAQADDGCISNERDNNNTGRKQTDVGRFYFQFISFAPCENDSLIRR